MKIKNISNKTIEFFKNNGKRIICLAATGFVLSTPSKAKLEEYSNNVTNDIGYVEEYQDEKLVFTVTTEWKKTDNYSDGKGPAKENREYKRTIRRMTIDENFNEDYFKDDYRKMLRTVEENKYENVFKVIEEMDEVITVDKNEENKLEKTYWTLEVEGTNIKEKWINPELEFNIKNTLAMFLVFGVLGGAALLGTALGDLVYPIHKKNNKTRVYKKVSKS